MRHWIERVFHTLHGNLLYLLMGANLLAALYAGPGLWIRDVSLGQAAFFGAAPVKLSLPLVMLAILLFNAGLGSNVAELRYLRRKPLPLLAGLAANLLLPMGFIALTAFLLQGWHSYKELTFILAGLSMVGAMPIAGSSTAWSQNADGDVSFSLGLVIFSTLLSPYLTPLVLNFGGGLIAGGLGADLQKLATHGSANFLTLAVIIPSLAGIAAHLLLRQHRVLRLKPYIKLLNILVLLTLSYSNAAVSLPQALRNFDPDFMLLIVLVTSALCLTAFVTGALLARLFRCSQPEQAALMFGLGMNNNGTGLVLSAIALGQYPMVMVPIILYNIIQQFLAGIVDRYLSRRARALPAASLGSNRAVSHP